MEKIQERYALDRLGWFTHTELIYSKELSKKLREFQVKYHKGDRYVLITYRAEASGGIEVHEIVEEL